MGVYLRRCELAVPQQFLNAFQPRPVVQHGGSERVAQHVGAAFLELAHQRQAFPDFAPSLVVSSPQALV